MLVHRNGSPATVGRRILRTITENDKPA